MESIEMCRICLDTDTKLYCINKYNLNVKYEELVPYKSIQMELPQFLCSFCVSLLNKYISFKEKAEESQELLETIAHHYVQITKELLNREITKKGHNYKSQFIGTTDSTFTPKIKEETQIIDEINNFDHVLKFDQVTKYDQDTMFDQPIIEDTDPNSSEEETKHEPTQTEYEIKKPDEPVDLINNKIIKKRNKNPDTSLFKKRILSKKEQMDSLLARKESNNYINSVFKCTYCYKGFLTELSYKDHMIKHDPSSGEYMCPICKVRRSTTRHLNHHIHSSHKMVYSCNLCPVTMKTLAKMNEHIRAHKGYQYICECGRSFSKNTSYLSHLKTHKKSRTMCDLCGQVFVGTLGLRMHLTMKHTREKYTVQCNNCERRFHNKNALIKHFNFTVNNICNKDMIFCEQCGDNFTTENDLTEHLNIHKKDIICSICNRKFATDKRLSTHFKRVHSKKPQNAGLKAFICEFCGNKYSTKSTLKQHRYNHTGEKPHKCPYCPMTFSTTNQRKYHEKGHTNERPFKCDCCTAAFKTVSSLVRHKRTHTGDRPYVCTYCGKAYTQTSTLKKHVNSAHFKEDFRRDVDLYQG